MTADDAESLELYVISNNEAEAEMLEAENNLIEDYLDESLTNEEIKAFNSHFLVTDERRERVELVKKIIGYAKNKKTAKPLKNTKPSFFEQLKAGLNPRKFAFGFGGIVLVLTIGFVSYLAWKSYSSYSDNSEISILLSKSFKNDRPTEARITGFDYAPKSEGTRGNGDKSPDLNLISAKSRATEAVLNNETAENLHDLGRVYLAEKNFDEAVEQFEKAVKLNPNIAAVHNDLGAALMEKASQKDDEKLELLAKANEEIEKSLELDKNLTAAYFNRGLVIESLNLPNQSREAWENYLKLDSSSQWADEARAHLQKLEINKPVSKTKEEILRDFLQAKQAEDSEKAWQILSRNREMITGKLIPQQLAFLFIDSKTNGDEAKAKEASDALVYVGKLEEKKSGDLFWRDLAEFYKNISNDRISKLKRAHDEASEGFIIYQRGNYEEAEKKFENSSKKYFELGNLAESKIYEYWTGNCLFYSNKIARNTLLFEKLADFCEKKNYKWLLSYAYSRLGYSQGSSNRRSKAIDYAHKSFILARETSDVSGIRRISSQIAEEYKQIGRLENSVKYLEQFTDVTLYDLRWNDYESLSGTFYSLKFYKTSEFYEKEAMLIAQTLESKDFQLVSGINLAAIFAAQGQYSKAESFIKKSEQVAETLTDSELKKKHLAYTKLQLANIKFEENEIQESLAYYDEAIRFYDSSEFQIDKYEAFKGQLLCSIKKGDNVEVELQLPVMLSLFEKYRSEILEEQNRNSFFDSKQSVYDIAIDYEFEKRNYAEAFNYSEYSRSRSLLDLQNSNVEVSTDEKQPEIKLPTNLSKPLKLSQIQAEMPENVQLLEYSVLQNKVLIWAVAKDNLNVVKIEISAESLERKIANYRKLILEHTELDEQSSLSRELYELLIAPIKSELDGNKEVFIIPDKALTELPFNTLFADKYFIEEYKISYSPSANVFLNCSRKAKVFDGKMSESLLSIGNPTFNQDEYENELKSLPSAKIEAEEVAKIYKNSLIYVEDGATKKRIKENLQSADIVHFAGHYIIDEHSPLLSSLVLAGNTKDESNLTNYEIIGEKLPRTRLIVLSACDTNSGKYYNGEGIIGASRTFLATGIPLVVASQWKVDSEAAKELMILFHNLRKLGKISTAEALRQAQLTMLKSEKFKQPYYWAAFMTFGGDTKF